MNAKDYIQNLKTEVDGNLEYVIKVLKSSLQNTAHIQEIASISEKWEMLKKDLKKNNIQALKHENEKKKIKNLVLIFLETLHEGTKKINKII